MREIYNRKIIGTIDQGTIINNCIAENYKDCCIFGIIITPRCDIHNSKIPTVHYLPLINLNDWIKVDFWSLFASRASNEIIGKIYGILDKYKESRSLIKYFSSSVLREKLKEKITKESDFVKFDGFLTDLETLKKKVEKIPKTQLENLLGNYKKISISIFKDLKENKKREYYLLESWESNSEYFVVLVREIRKLTFEIATKISTGIYESQISEEEWENNDIRKLSDDDSFTYTLATLKSPEIEHLIQHFFWNFGRIGVDNHTLNLEEDFHNRIKNIL